MYTVMGVLLALELSRSTITKSSTTLEKTSTALAKMAGVSIGRMTRQVTCQRLAPRSAAASSYCLPIVASLACTMIAGQLTFQVTSARVSAIVPSPMPRNKIVNTKNIATPKISSGITKDKIMMKLNDAEVRLRHLLMPMANATPSGTAIRVVKTDSRTVCTTAARSSGLLSTEFTGSPKYQRQEKPWKKLCDLPRLNENRTASATGTSDQIR